MKTLISLVIFLLISANSYSQIVKYSIEAGGNYSFIPKKSYETINIQPSTIPFNDGYIVLILPLEKETESQGKLGFVLNNNFTFPINKHISFKTGLGFSINKLNLKISSKYYIPYYYGEDSICHPLIINDTTLNMNSYWLKGESSYSVDYDMFILKIPLLIQSSLFNERLLFTSGVSMSIMAHVKRKYNSNINLYTSPFLKDIFLNINFGLEYKVFKNIYFGVYYERSISDIRSYKPFIDPEIYYNQKTSNKWI